MNTPPSSPVSVVERARRYLSSLPPAVSGSGGHSATFRAAVAMVKGFDLEPETALRLLEAWNEACLPPWSGRELRHKLADAGRSRSPSGYLLQGRDRPAPARASGLTAEQKRARWPVFECILEEEMEALSALRGLSMETLALVHTHGLLRRCEWKGHACFVIRQGTFAQVRRMDGGLLPRTDGEPVKTLNLPGSVGSFLIPGGLGDPSVPVLLTEGAVSVLEAAEAVLRADEMAGRLHPVAVVAAVSAGSRFRKDELAALAGRRIRIIPDADPTGQNAGAAWAATLRGSGCTVDTLRVPPRPEGPGRRSPRAPAGRSLLVTNGHVLIFTVFTQYT